MTSSRRAERTAASLIVECLEVEGCRWVFSVPGEETLALLDAISRSASVQHVTTRHEQGAAFLADVHGRLTGRVAVALATFGPGATNLLTGIADAYLDRAPMVAITGQASSDKLHKEAHQVVDIVRMFERRSFGIAGFRPTSSADLYPTLMRALAVDGPALVEVPIDYRENVRLTEHLGMLSGSG